MSTLARPKLKITDAIINLNSEQIVKLAEELQKAQEDARRKLHVMSNSANWDDKQAAEWHSLVHTVERNASIFNDELVPVMALTPFLAKKFGLEQKKDSIEEAKDAEALRLIAGKMEARSARGLERAAVLEKVVATKQ